MIFRGQTPQQSIDRAAARKRRRRDNAKFIAETQGVTVRMSRKNVVAQLDHLFSLFIRRRDRAVRAGFCLICGNRPIEVCYHLTPRGAHMTRWNEENAVGACSPCNWAERNNRILYRHKHVTIFGAERIERMEALSRERSHFTLADLVAMRDDLRLKLGGA